MEERMEFAKEEGLHQLIALRNVLPKLFGIKEPSLIGQLAPRQLLIMVDQHEDFVNSLVRSVNYFKYNGKEHQIRIFPWSLDFKVNEETTKAVVWISLPNLPTELFAMKALLSIASVVGKPIAIDKATQTKSRPSAARVKVILDLMDKLHDKLFLQFVDKQTGKIVEFFQDFVYDNLPLYCNCCKHQGHDEKTCHRLNKNTTRNVQCHEETVDIDRIMPAEVLALAEEMSKVGKLQGDARDYLIAKSQQKTNASLHADIPVDRSLARVSNAVNLVRETMLMKETGQVVSAGNVDEGAVFNGGVIAPVEAALYRISEELQVDAHAVKDPKNNRVAPGQFLPELTKPTAAISTRVPNTKVAALEAAVQTPSINVAGVRGSGVKEVGQSCKGQRQEKDQQVTQAEIKKNEANKGGETTDRGALKPTVVLKHTVDPAVIDPKFKSAGQLEVVAAQKSDAQGVQNAKAGDWSVVHRSHPSPNKATADLV
uniref:Uncharacterized protein LOC104245823 isoform X1 n=1 Tax=Nicotiana sylvestris TaxID=4096 RepID=A0A1U7Y9M5_NICSY|nr:PREDICTED: uncharacterized protein LOC104245823 isoform X1 [Nicotiana sylvestris]